MIQLYFCREQALPNPPNQIFLDLCSPEVSKPKEASKSSRYYSAVVLGPCGSFVPWACPLGGVGRRWQPAPLQNNICSMSRTLAAYPEFLFLPATWQLLSGNNFKLENEITKTQLEKYPQISPTYFFYSAKINVWEEVINANFTSQMISQA